MKCSRKTEDRIRKTIIAILLTIAIVIAVLVFAFGVYYKFDIVAAIVLGAITVFSGLSVVYWLAGDINICLDD